MSGSFGFDKLPDFSGLPGDLLRDQQETLSKMTEYQEKLAEVVGRAESEDGHVSVAYSQTQGVHELELNPRAMRMASQDLATTIEDVIARARSDYDRQVRELTNQTFSGAMPHPTTMAQSQQRVNEQLGDLTSMAKQSSQELATMVQRIMSVMPGGVPTQDEFEGDEAKDDERSGGTGPR